VLNARSLENIDGSSAPEAERLSRARLQDIDRIGVHFTVSNVAENRFDEQRGAAKIQRVVTGKNNSVVFGEDLDAVAGNAESAREALAERRQRLADRRVNCEQAAVRPNARGITEADEE
jgi:hypothetical protein